jgi:hypothetical protein
MTDDHPENNTPNTPDEIELWDRHSVCAFFGGREKPIHISTLYRGMARGLYPRPVNVAANVARWLGHECRAVRQRMLAERSKPAPTTLPRRGRPPKARSSDATATAEA